MSVIDALITDRSQTDLNLLNTMLAQINEYGWDSLTPTEKNNWLNLHAKFDKVDYNRVGEAISYLVTKLDSNGYHLYISPVISWLYDSVQLIPDNTSLLTMLELLKVTFYNNSPALPTDIISLDNANNIEAFLVNLDYWLNNMIVGKTRYVGTFYPGGNSL